MSQGERMQSAVNLIPFVSEVLLEAPQLATTIGAIFVKNGGTEEEYGVIREHARETASKLGHPDTYFDPPAPKTEGGH